MRCKFQMMTSQGGKEEEGGGGGRRRRKKKLKAIFPKGMNKISQNK